MNEKKYDSLFIAAGSLLFVNIFMPVVDALCSLVINKCNQVINGWMLDMELDKQSAEIQSVEMGHPDCKTQAIGFAIPEEIETYEEDDE